MYSSKYLAIPEPDKKLNRYKSAGENYEKTGNKWLYPIYIVILALIFVSLSMLIFNPTITGLTTGEILVFENLTTNFTFNEITINSTVDDIILNQTIIIDPINYSTSIPLLNLTLPIENNSLINLTLPVENISIINSTNLTLPITINQSDENIQVEIINESIPIYLTNLTLPGKIELNEPFIPN